MSRIEEKLSKVFLNQVPEFLRAAEDATTITTLGSTTINSKLVSLSSSSGLKIGDKLTHASIATNIYITQIISNTKVRVDKVVPVTITNSLLSFVRTDRTSNFVKFIEAYFKFLEQDQGPQELLQNARKYADSETTIDSLIETFFSQYGDDIPRNIKTDKRTFIKFFKDIHQTKGSEEAYSLLFRILFDEDISFYYPEQSILKASDGQWVRTVVMRVLVDPGSNAFNFKNTKITGSVSGATATVYNVLKHIAEGYIFYELYLENVVGTFVSETITTTKLLTVNPTTTVSVSGRTIPLVRGIDIVYKGAGYTQDTLVNFESSGGKNAFGRVKNVDETGGILSVDMIDPGVFYTSVDPPNVTTTVPSRTISGNVTFVNNVATFISTDKHGLAENDTVYVSLASNTEVLVTVQQLVGPYKFRFDQNYLGPNAAANIRYENNAVLEANIGFSMEYPGYWQTSKGKLSEDIFIQGSLADAADPNVLYYQPFSYVINSGRTTDEWLPISKEVLHPIGTAVFGQIEINSLNNSNIQLAANTEIWDYIGFTSDYAGNVVSADTATITNSRVTDLNITTDMVYYKIGML